MAAIAALEMMRTRGAEYLLLPSTSFWWLEHYRHFHRELRERFACVLENERVVVFDVRGRTDPAPRAIGGGSEEWTRDRRR